MDLKFKMTAIQVLSLIAGISLGITVLAKFAYVRASEYDGTKERLQIVVVVTGVIGVIFAFIAILSSTMQPSVNQRDEALRRSEAACTSNGGVWLYTGDSKFQCFQKAPQ